LCNNSWALHHDNVPTHTSLLAWQLLTSMKMTVLLPLPTHQTSPRDFFLFWKMKSKLMEWHFESTEEI
jgi:hypothetical protein